MNCANWAYSYKRGLGSLSFSCHIASRKIVSNTATNACRRWVIEITDWVLRNGGEDVPESQIDNAGIRKDLWSQKHHFAIGSWVTLPMFRLKSPLNSLIDEVGWRLEDRGKAVSFEWKSAGNRFLDHFKSDDILNCKAKELRGRSCCRWEFRIQPEQRSLPSHGYRIKSSQACADPETIRWLTRAHVWHAGHEVQISQAKYSSCMSLSIKTQRLTICKGQIIEIFERACYVPKVQTLVDFE